MKKSCHTSEEIYAFADNYKTFGQASNTESSHRPKSMPYSNAKDVIMTNSPECKNCVIARHNVMTIGDVVDDDDDDDVTQELIRRLDQLVEYSDGLQVQLTVCKDENDQLVRDNWTLTRRLELLAKIAGNVKGMNRAREESERRALRAEFELETVRQRCDTLEDSVRVLETRNRELVQLGDCALCSTAASSNLVSVLSGFSDKYELKPRG